MLIKSTNLSKNLPIHCTTGEDHQKDMYTVHWRGSLERHVHCTAAEEDHQEDMYSVHYSTVEDHQKDMYTKQLQRITRKTCTVYTVQLQRTTRKTCTLYNCRGPLERHVHCTTAEDHQKDMYTEQLRTTRKTCTLYTGEDNQKTV